MNATEGVIEDDSALGDVEDTTTADADDDTLGDEPLDVLDDEAGEDDILDEDDEPLVQEP